MCKHQARYELNESPSSCRVEKEELSSFFFLELTTNTKTLCAHRIECVMGKILVELKFVTSDLRLIVYFDPPLVRSSKWIQIKNSLFYFSHPWYI